jgi:regulator of PEP synthase PpsR (kinase-PPPase family)
MRGERAKGMGGGGSYSDLAEIYEELDHAEEVYKRLGCPVIEVSNLAIEETARRIVRIVEERRLRAGATR